MNAVFPPWPIREFRDRSDGIPEAGREDSIFRGAGRFVWRTTKVEDGAAARSQRSAFSGQLLNQDGEHAYDFHGLS